MPERHPSQSDRPNAPVWNTADVRPECGAASDSAESAVDKEQAELLRRYHEQLRQRLCPGCGEDHEIF